MRKWNKLSLLEETGLVAVIRRPSNDQVDYIAESLVNGGIGALEITVDTIGSFQMIERLKRRYRNTVLVGAGTVLDAVTAKTAIDAGADFIFAPIVDRDTIQITNKYGKISIPGAMTPTEIVTAYEMGADVIKVFPADAMGLDYIKNVRGPLEHIPMMPTGGVSLDNVQKFIENGAMAVGAGGALVDSAAIKAEKYEDLTAKAKQFVTAIQLGRRQREDKQ
ncbi:bifunctional 4-hydroxy-2-oxoglutarate aldolase/2-dehydro-3-deoxy-phosphogluconate aldolase [Aquibacillus sp. 3ASR75-11]|uniref:Bifunctional 4-hydroxy-2-oxoglutarate aldolase/2-dehydro-3-deoxy-phosphogluconate aldolase n=1 Tax=Terrihalobacillus insolitus TaxID=2950438 RepID=A0A9X4AKB6_9BACI|nr:bifunctional 4-hydroxy-2-oxoglutarate aldolase/2-dehydro-3-deoxy-phosphogluconate aldolase [Terrihalobacillus insolitus]MDC3412194.1 bifunctional 4-hydroxy-2-oxoglutarate aldolase/2-dehydro-3-deoxy-phosphogluconate aldolase [Terrihalobacillus insolitus]MDC3423112.1 bifunctional 4-hydroxy-2-oxoglutarate aldolase/2-dehydro-3-deoxy-phosphogluconate aldolase [Terrihalobacillus insolitus]